jgi:hypothetical protein
MMVSVTPFAGREGGLWPVRFPQICAFGQLGAGVAELDVVLDAIRSQGWAECYLWDDDVHQVALQVLNELGARSKPFYGGWSYGRAQNVMQLQARASGSEYFVRVDPGTTAPSPESFQRLLGENLLLRHQLAVLTRPTRSRSPARLRLWDKLLWILARRFCAGVGRPAPVADGRISVPLYGT